MHRTTFHYALDVPNTIVLILEHHLWAALQAAVQ